ncbi:unnamed protein product [Notodromas monacha]|uniref:RRM domain-containing protein n=1 Tax=Notodromas monacha TaxID=399045 RepID=A0A7R9BW74_9CRUS|nr:unnamed protein product [Notodromas monacha]CAG0921715.1 unnamed protein product [Notodromas monacha]
MSWGRGAMATGGFRGRGGGNRGGFGGGGDMGQRQDVDFQSDAGFENRQGPPFKRARAEEPENRIILLTIAKPNYPITVTLESAREAKDQLQGADIYSGCCTLSIEFGKPQRLNVTKNDSETYDFTNPNLPSSHDGRQDNSGYGQAQQRRTLLNNPQGNGGDAGYNAGGGGGAVGGGGPGYGGGGGYNNGGGFGGGKKPFGPGDGMGEQQGYRGGPGQGPQGGGGGFPGGAGYGMPEQDYQGRPAQNFGPGPNQGFGGPGFGGGPGGPGYNAGPPGGNYGGGMGMNQGGEYDMQGWGPMGPGMGPQHGAVLMVYGLNQEKFNADKVFNLFCLYGNVRKVKFLKTKDSTAMVEMGDAEAAAKCIEVLHNVTVLGSQLQLQPSKQEFLTETGRPFDLNDGSKSFVNFENSRNNRFTSPEQASKNRLVAPTKTLHFYNSPPHMSDDEVKKIFSDAGAPEPTEVIMLETRAAERSSAGKVVFASAEDAVDALTLANHTALPSPNGKSVYIFKVCFTGQGGMRGPGGPGGPMGGGPGGPPRGGGQGFRGGRGGRGGPGGGFNRGGGGGPGGPFKRERISCGKFWMVVEKIRCDYDLTCDDANRRISFDVPSPKNVREPCAEYSARILRKYDFPIFLQDAMEENVRRFVEDTEKATCEDFFSGFNVDALLSQSSDIAKNWASWFNEETKSKKTRCSLTDEEIFSEAYHNLLHSARSGSGGLVPILQKERTTATDLDSLVKDRDRDLSETKERHTEEMETLMYQLELGSVTVPDVNSAAEKHHHECESAEKAWNTQIASLHQTRRDEFRSWIMSMHLDSYLSADSQPSPGLDEEEFERWRGTEGRKGGAGKKKQRFWESSEPSSGRTSVITSPSSSSLVDLTLEESFTIQLGAQMKHTHNLRLLAAGPFSLCRQHRIFSEKPSYPDPIRMHTAMSLYSEKLHGVVIFVDNRISSFSGRKREFASICEIGPEFHFAPLEEQLENMRTKILPEAMDWRKEHNTAESSLPTNGMTQGDFYVTTHSNLEQVHVVFHLVADSEVVLSADAVSSRHPVILGLRNVLKACSLSDITTLSIPLFLTHEMAEEMTISWCVKRAELVFKCVKGFMMEMASWGGSLLTTLQFVVPEDVSENLFNQLTALLPSVFRVSNPLVMKTTGNK